MGYGRELTGLGAISRRHRAAWQPHLDKTKALILEAADLCDGGDRVLILGSGLLLDVPLAEISRRFREVVLADILHLRSARREARRYPNIRLAQVDVTGVVQLVYALARRGRPASLPECRPDLFLDEKFDLVASINLLSQLPVVPAQYAAARIGGLTVQEIDEFSRKVVENHLDWLASFPGITCLVADLERMECDGRKILSRENALWGVCLPEGGRTWLWNIAPRPTARRDREVRHRVIGFPRFPAKAWLDRRR